MKSHQLRFVAAIAAAVLVTTLLCSFEPALAGTTLSPPDEHEHLIRRVQTLEIPGSFPAWYALLYHRNKVFVGTANRGGSIHVIDKKATTASERAGADASSGGNKHNNLILDPTTIRKATSEEEAFHGAVQSDRFGFFFGSRINLVTELDLESERRVAIFTGFDPETGSPVDPFFSREIQDNESLAISFTTCALTHSHGSSDKPETLLCASFPHKDANRPCHLFGFDAGTLQLISVQNVEPLVRFGDMAVGMTGHPSHPGIVFLLSQHALFKLKTNPNDSLMKGTGDDVGAQAASLLVGRPLTRDKFSKMRVFTAFLIHDDILYVTGASEAGHKVFRVDVSGDPDALLEMHTVATTTLGDEPRSIFMNIAPSCATKTRGCRFLYFADPGKARIHRYDIESKSFFAPPPASSSSSLPPGGELGENADNKKKKKNNNKKQKGKNIRSVPVFAAAQIQEAQLWGMAVDYENNLLFAGSAIDPTDVTVFDVAPSAEEPEQGKQKQKDSSISDL